MTGKCKVAPVAKSALQYKFNPHTSWKRIVSVMLYLLYPHEKEFTWGGWLSMV